MSETEKVINCLVSTKAKFDGLIEFVNKCVDGGIYWLENDSEQIAKAIQMVRQRDQLLTALEKILVDPSDCPMCDSGMLRGVKPHWDSCDYAAASKLVAAIKGGAA